VIGRRRQASPSAPSSPSAPAGSDEPATRQRDPLAAAGGCSPETGAGRVSGEDEDGGTGSGCVGVTVPGVGTTQRFTVSHFAGAAHGTSAEHTPWAKVRANGCP
jgi:hypothetical protein